MKPSYNNINLKNGAINSGTCAIKLILKEFVIDDFEFNNDTGIIISNINIANDRSFTILEFAPYTYNFDEKNETSKSGDFFTTTVAGTINNISASILQTLQTLLYHELIVICKDKQKTERVVGNLEKGANLKFNTKSPSNSSIIEVSITHISESTAPFYLPS